MFNLLNNTRVFIVLFVLMTTLLFPQGWNSIVQTEIPYAGGSGHSTIDLCTNKNGNNILVYYYNPPTIYLKYYLVNTSGSILRSSNPFETQAVEFANIDGNDDKVYVVYKIGSTIKTKKSTNGGQSWIDMQNINIEGNPCNNVDIIWGTDDNSLHVVWATRDSYPYYKTYYQKLYNDQWWSKEYVTDGNYVGGFPTVSKSNHRVHVSHNTGFSSDPLSNVGDAKTRDKYYDEWQSPQMVFPDNSKRERIHAGSSKLFDFYYEDMSWYCNLLVKEREFNSTSWSDPELFDYFADPTQIISATNTNDGNSHVVYTITGGVGYRKYEDNQWTSESSILNTYISPRISSASNDLYAISCDFNHVYYRQYDANPLAPQNLQVTRSLNNHPLLTWTANTEPDLNHYLLKKYDREWTTFSVTGTSYEDVTETFCTAPPPLRCSDGHTVSYYVVAVDNNSHSSPPSNEAKAFVNGGEPMKVIAQNPQSTIDLSFKLEQNNPNPFNPTTSITYSIKDRGLVSLKVYDVLGTEVADLVNEVKEPGVYSASFNAKNYPSGVYIYQIRVNDYVSSKKMMLLR